MSVLLVEDNDDHAELVLRSLEDHHVANNITRASDGQEALDYLLRRGRYSDPATAPFPDLILLDLRLPRVDGLDVLEQIKSNPELSDIPVVVLTTSQAEQDLARAYQRKANAYVLKPVDFDKFIELMRDLGFFWLAWNQHPRRA
jgi:CheY-like chemotaxis protein